jgi:flagellar hook-basal body complex protein FliE
MALESVGGLAPLARLTPLTSAPAEPTSGVGGFGAVFDHLLAENRQANAAATAAVEDLATGKSQDLHSVTLAVAQADVSFRLMLEIRNRITDAFQEISRMQV